MKFAEWLEKTLAGQSVQDSVRTIILCWSIWRARNDLVWNGKRWTSIKIVAEAWEYLSQWTLAQWRRLGVPIHPPVAGDGALFWVKPHLNEVKITADATTLKDQGVSCVGIIARDHEGHLILAKTRSFMEVLNPTLVEAIAVKEALSCANEKSWKAVTVETDCLVVVQLIRSNTPMRSR